MESVIAVPFADPNEAYEALTKLKMLDQQRQVNLREGGVVKRDVNGQLIIKDRMPNKREDEVGLATAGGGLIGLLIGVIGGPLGMLLGGSLGLVTGSVIDLDTIAQEEDDESVLAEYARRLQPNWTAVFALVDEQTPEVVDAAMTTLGGSVYRRPAADVRAELAAAAAARDEAEHEARKQLRKERRDEHQEKVDAKLDALRAKLHKGEKAPTAS